MNSSDYIGETTEYDKKQEVERRKVKNWLKSVSAFANGKGGCLLFGIADDDTIVGLANAKADAEFVSQKIKERIDPVPQIVLEIEKLDQKEILVVKILPGDDTPYYYMGDGVLETFVRIGNESVVADATEHKRLVLKGRNTSFDARLADESIDNFAFTKLRSRFYAWSGQSFDDKLYRSFGMVDTNGILTNAGLLMSDECPIRQSRVFCTRWNGTTKASGSIDALDSIEIKGGLVSLLEDTMTFIRRNTRTIWYKEPMQRIEIPEYLERSVMEAVTNALAHRDYLISGSEVHIDMFDDRLVVFSPGAMPEGHLIQELNIENVPSIRRNPVIADIFAQLGYMERKGSGMGKIINPIKELPFYTQSLLPTFFSDRAQFTVTFPNIIAIWETLHPGVKPHIVNPNNVADNVAEQLTERQRNIVKILTQHVADNVAVNTSYLAQHFGLSRKTIQRDLAVLQQHNLIQWTGTDKTGHWQLTSNI